MNRRPHLVAATAVASFLSAQVQGSAAAVAASHAVPHHPTVDAGPATMQRTAAHAAAPSAASAPASVAIGNFTFKAPVVTVKAGTTVTWTNADDIPHTVVAKDGSFKSKVLDTGDRFSFTFAKPGQYLYFCSLHPHMTGTIIVKV